MILGDCVGRAEWVVEKSKIAQGGSETSQDLLYGTGLNKLDIPAVQVAR